ncbi:tetratricopeptide repeat protein [Arthrobacter sp. FW306-05-C]|uniref:tetratricopeptide repeat protein n=1 Tax=unclassified Arthrobacter TaxID=235627 RepID=UPI001EEFB6AF|nr:MULTISPECIES: tetratricopeptide repeat protein [unclassified Arthrobacter]UKA65041.1 tetratricopeptide repeat protein [Arthrobacter sp. FW306-05-C]UKA73713.1 tetratricopeptide repeat protein [Arthrobacter sp. FW306-07-I]
MQGDISGTADWPEAGFPGIRINPDSLQPQIVNEDVVRETLAASSDPADQIFVLLVEGHASEAAELLAEARFKDPESFLLRIFEAEVLSVSHRMDRAVGLFRQLLAEAHGTPGEALALQYLGRAQYAAGQTSAAVESFSRALDLRVAQSADAAQIYSSTVALQRARDVLDLAC